MRRLPPRSPPRNGRSATSTRARISAICRSNSAFSARSAANSTTETSASLRGRPTALGENASSAPCSTRLRKVPNCVSPSSKSSQASSTAISPVSVAKITCSRHLYSGSPVSAST